jgi:hypothetical protein
LADRTTQAFERGLRGHHPLVASAERGERWLYCYVDEEFAKY